MQNSNAMLIFYCFWTEISEEEKSLGGCKLLQGSASCGGKPASNLIKTLIKITFKPRLFFPLQIDFARNKFHCRQTSPEYCTNNSHLQVDTYFGSITKSKQNFP